VQLNATAVNGAAAADAEGGVAAAAVRVAACVRATPELEWILQVCTVTCRYTPLHTVVACLQVRRHYLEWILQVRASSSRAASVVARRRACLASAVSARASPRPPRVRCS
jgi:hypothetical protein